jgi:hypothetical protein
MECVTPYGKYLYFQLTAAIKVAVYTKHVEVGWCAIPTNSGMTQHYGHYHGFFSSVDIWKMSTLLSRRVSDFANHHGWGADSERMWAT